MAQHHKTDVILAERLPTHTLEKYIYSSKIVDSRFGWQRLSSVTITGKLVKKNGDIQSV